MSLDVTLKNLVQSVDRINDRMDNLLAGSHVVNAPRIPVAPIDAAPSAFIPSQRTRRTAERSRVPAAISAVYRNRVWELFLETGGARARTVSDLMIALLAEGYSLVTPMDVRTWIARWELLGRLRRTADDRIPSYELVDGGRDRAYVDERFLVPTEADPVPLLLRLAFDEFSASGRKVLHTRTLAAALGISSYLFGAHLGPLVRESGALRPAGNVREVPGGPLAPGYSEECLRQTVAAYEAKAEQEA